MQHTHTHTYLYEFKCIFENICDDPLEFAFLWHVTRFVIFLWRSVRRVGAAQNANCKRQTLTHMYIREYVLMYICITLASTKICNTHTRTHI